MVYLINTRKLRVIREMRSNLITKTYNDAIACPKYKKIVFLKGLNIVVLNYMTFKVSTILSPIHLRAGCRFKTHQNLILAGGNNSNSNWVVIVNIENNEVILRKLLGSFTQIHDI